MDSPPFPAQVLAETKQWGTYFGSEWARDFPEEIHEARLGEDGRPRWQGEFSRWLTNGPDEEQRHRTTRVMRKLRHVAPREYEVAYRAMVLGESFEEITRWLNQRAQRNSIPLPPGRPVHYRVKDAIALFICAIEFARWAW